MLLFARLSPAMNSLLNIVYLDGVITLHYALYNDNADCVAFSLTSVGVLLSVGSLSFSNVYLPARTRYFVYSCGAEWKSLEIESFKDIF